MKTNTTHWWRRLLEAGEIVAVKSCETTMRAVAALDERRAGLLAELREENEGVLEQALREWTPEEIAGAIEGWDAPTFWDDVMNSD